MRLAIALRSVLHELGVPIRTHTEPPAAPGDALPEPTVDDQPQDVVGEPDPAPLGEAPAGQSNTATESPTPPVADPPAASAASQPATTKSARFGAWIRNVFGVGASSPNDPLRLVSALGVAGVTGVISYNTLLQLGDGIGFDGVGAHLFPIGIDAAVFLFTRTWMNRRLAEDTRRMGKRSAIFFMLMSVLGNAIEHGKRAYDTWTSARLAAAAVHRSWQPSLMDITWLGVTLLFSALMPLALGLSLHVISKVADDGRKIRDDAAQAEQDAATEAQQPPRARRRSRRRPAEQPPAQEPVAEESKRPDVAPAETADVIDLETPRRPEWITDDMTPRQVVYGLLDRNGAPVKNAALLTRWLRTWGYEVSDDYGRTTQNRWKRERTDDPVAAGER